MKWRGKRRKIHFHGILRWIIFRVSAVFACCVVCSSTSREQSRGDIDTLPSWLLHFNISSHHRHHHHRRLMLSRLAHSLSVCVYLWPKSDWLLVVVFHRIYSSVSPMLTRWRMIRAAAASEKWSENRVLRDFKVHNSPPDQEWSFKKTWNEILFVSISCKTMKNLINNGRLDSARRCISSRFKHSAMTLRRKVKKNIIVTSSSSIIIRWLGGAELFHSHIRRRHHSTENDDEKRNSKRLKINEKKVIGKNENNFHFTLLAAIVVDERREVYSNFDMYSKLRYALLSVCGRGRKFTRVFQTRFIISREMWPGRRRRRCGHFWDFIRECSITRSGGDLRLFLMWAQERTRLTGVGQGWLPSRRWVASTFVRFAVPSSHIFIAHFHMNSTWYMLYMSSRWVDLYFFFFVLFRSKNEAREQHTTHSIADTSSSRWTFWLVCHWTLLVSVFDGIGEVHREGWKV